MAQQNVAVPAILADMITHLQRQDVYVWQALVLEWLQQTSQQQLMAGDAP
jgi:hypothetical protein